MHERLTGLPQARAPTPEEEKELTRKRETTWLTILWFVCYLCISWRCGLAGTMGHFLSFNWLDLRCDPLPMTKYFIINLTLTTAAGFLLLYLIIEWAVIIAKGIWGAYPMWVCFIGLLWVGLQVGHLLSYLGIV